MANVVDMELRKAFQDLQNKMIATTQQLKVSDIQIESLKRQINHSHLVQKDLSTLPSETRTYEGVGRMFVLTPIARVKTNLDIKVKNHQDKIKTIESNKSYLERNLKESEDNLRELVQQKKSAK